MYVMPLDYHLTNPSSQSVLCIMLFSCASQFSDTKGQRFESPLQVRQPNESPGNRSVIPENASKSSQRTLTKNPRQGYFPCRGFLIDVSSVPSLQSKYKGSGGFFQGIGVVIHTLVGVALAVLPMGGDGQFLLGKNRHLQ